MEPIVRVDKYILSTSDDVTYPHYYGFINDLGDWYIMKELSNQTVLFFRAKDNTAGLFLVNWNNRATLNFYYWDALI